MERYTDKSVIFNVSHVFFSSWLLSIQLVYLFDSSPQSIMASLARLSMLETMFFSFFRVFLTSGVMISDISDVSGLVFFC